MKALSLAVALILLGQTATAACPEKSPKLDRSFFSSGDQKVNAAWLEKNLSGRKVVFESGGTESYRKDGSYSYKEGGNSWKAPSYKFYDNGLRCIGYDNPRFDLYVVNGGQLHLVNRNKERYVGKIRK